MVKNLPANAGDTRDPRSILASGRSPGVENGNSFQHSCLENIMDREAQCKGPESLTWFIVHDLTYSARGQRVWHDLATKHTHSQDFIQTDTHRWLNASMITIMDFWFYAMPTWVINIYVHISCGILCIYIYRDSVYIFTEYIWSERQ